MHSPWTVSFLVVVYNASLAIKIRELRIEYELELGGSALRDLTPDY